MPCGADLVSGIAGIEQAQELRAPAVIEAFFGLGEEAAGSVERIAIAAR